MLVRIKIVFWAFLNLFLGYYSYAQNLVPNPSFERLIGPRVNCHWTLFPHEIDGFMDAWVDPTQATPDIFSLLANESCWTYPNKSNVYTGTSGWQIPRTGKSMIGIVTFEPYSQWKEYMQVKLQLPMLAGTQYRVRFYVSLAESSRFASKNIGAYFSVSTIRGFKSNLPYIPQVESDRVIYDYLNWVKIDTVITATDNWNYITIGNFRKNSSIDSIPFKTRYSDGSDRVSYYYLDDVSVRPNCLDVSKDQFICPGASVVLTASGANFIGWSEYNNPSMLLSTSTHFTVSPSIPTTYLAYSLCDTNSVLVKMETFQTFDLGKDTTLCKGDPLILNAVVTVDGTRHRWQDGTTEPMLRVFNSGYYSVSALIGGCYPVKDSIRVVFQDAPNVSLGLDTMLCAGQTIVLDATYPGASYQWLKNGSTSSKITVSDSGTYGVKISLPNGCVRTPKVKVQYSATIPDVQLGKDLILCPKEQYELKAIPFNYSSTSIPIKFQWQNGSYGSNFIVTSPGIYWTKVNMAGCVDADSIVISYYPKSLFQLGNDTLLCSGQVLMLNASYPGATYFWQDQSTTPAFTVSTFGTYFVAVKYNNCNYRDTVKVNYLETPHPDISKIQGIENGESLLLDATFPNATYTWQNGSTGSTFQVNQEGKYWVSVANQNYCFDSDTVCIYDIRIKMPNVFSPNGDGKNDSFVPIDMNGFLSASIYVTNRWGDTIFESSNFSNHQGWDGKHAGSDAPEGIYFWMVKLQDVNGKDREVKGTLSLVR